MKQGGKEHRGHAANVEEAAGENGSVITDYRYGQNVYSDSQFLKDSIDNAPEQEEERILVADGVCGAIARHCLPQGRQAYARSFVALDAQLRCRF